MGILKLTTDLFCDSWRHPFNHASDLSAFFHGVYKDHWNKETNTFDVNKDMSIGKDGVSITTAEDQSINIGIKNDGKRGLGYNIKLGGKKSSAASKSSQDPED